jgi:capsular polysaccharide biosynthesis protein
MPEIADIFGNKHFDFTSYETIVPPHNVFIIKNGKCIIGREEVFNKNNFVLVEITSQTRNPFLGKRTQEIKEVTQIKGSVANLSLSFELANNYYHFMVEYSARLFMLRKSSIEPDYYICPKKNRFQKDFLAYHHVDECRILDIDDGVVVQAENLITTSLINNWEYVKYRGTTYYQKQYLPIWINKVYNSYTPKIRGNKNIYISRSNARYRKIENEDMIIKYLDKYNFEVHYLENYSVEQQIKLFNECAVLIAPHGAGLINMCFCMDGIKILEIFPEYYHDHSFVLQALFLKHKYYYLIGKTPIIENTAPIEENIQVDLEIFSKAVDLLLATKTYTPRTAST